MWMRRAGNGGWLRAEVLWESFSVVLVGDGAERGLQWGPGCVVARTQGCTLVRHGDEPG